MTNIRVVLADDHPVVRSSIRELLNEAQGIEVIGEASNGYEALRLVENLTPDVLLLDMEMPGLKGIEVAQQLQQTQSPVNILALSTYDDKEYILGLLASGASGYLIKGESPQMIIKAIRGVARGEKGWLSRQVSVQINTFIPHEKLEKHNELTDQEIAILKLMVVGKTPEEIRMALTLEEKTVEKEVRQIEAVMRAVQEGFI
jgi:DNA-binding NarL/FixJ family response regulator